MQRLILLVDDACISYKLTRGWGLILVFFHRTGLGLCDEMKIKIQANSCLRARLQIPSFDACLSKILAFMHLL